MIQVTQTGGEQVLDIETLLRTIIKRQFGTEEPINFIYIKDTARVNPHLEISVPKGIEEEGKLKLLHSIERLPSFGVGYVTITEAE